MLEVILWIHWSVSSTVLQKTETNINTMVIEVGEDTLDTLEQDSLYRHSSPPFLSHLIPTPWEPQLYGKGTKASVSISIDR